MMKKQLKPKASENDILKQITDWLSYNQFFWLYCPNKGRHDTSRDNVTVGAPDIIVIIKGIFVGVEVKAPTGKQTKDQKDFQKAVGAAGGLYILTYSVDDLRPLENIRNGAVFMCAGDIKKAWIME